MKAFFVHESMERNSSHDHRLPRAGLSPMVSAASPLLGHLTLLLCHIDHVNCHKFIYKAISFVPSHCSTVPIEQDMFLLQSVFSSRCLQ